MKESLEDLDGVFTYMAVTEDALGVAKDEMAAKPLVLYESDDLVAMASEEVAIRAHHRPRDRHVRPVRARGAGVDAVATGERRITYDARGLAEPDADVPKISEIDGAEGDVQRGRPDDAPDQPRAALAAVRAGHRRRHGAEPRREALDRASGILTRCRIRSRARSGTSASG